MSKNMSVNVRNILSERMSAEQKRITEADKLLPANQVKVTTTKIVTSTLLATTIVGSTVPVFADNRLEMSSYKGEGFISITEEVGVNGNGGTISTGKGDHGGVSYGIAQLSTKKKSIHDFINNEIKPNHPEFYKFFEDAGEPGTEKFNEAWTKAYNYNPGKFEQIQIDYKEENFVKPAQKMIKNELGIDMFASRARLELLHSSSVQFGPTGMTNLLKEAGVDKNMDDKELLSKIDDYKIKTVDKKFKSSSQETRNSVSDRYKREKKALLKIAKEEAGPSLEDVMNGEHVESDNSEEIVETAKSYLNQGTTYKMGGKNTTKLDCSGYVSLVYQDLGLDIDEMMTNAGKFRQDSKEIKREELKEGDLVFWHDLTGKKHAKVFHIGIYVGDDTVVDCSIDHNGVGTRKLSSLQDKEGDRYFTFGRYEGVNNQENVIDVSKEEEFDSIIKVDESIKEDVKKEDELLDSMEEENSIVDTDKYDELESEEENSIVDTDKYEELESEEENPVVDTDKYDELESEDENSIVDTDKYDEPSDDEKIEPEPEEDDSKTDIESDTDKSEQDDTETEQDSSNDDKSEQDNTQTEQDSSNDDKSEQDNTQTEQDSSNSGEKEQDDTQSEQDSSNSDKSEQDDTQSEQDSSDSDEKEQDNTQVEQDSSNDDKSEQDDINVEQDSSNSDGKEQNDTQTEQGSSDSNEKEQNDSKVEENSSNDDKKEQGDTKVEQDNSDSNKKEETTSNIESNDSNSESNNVDDNTGSKNFNDSKKEELDTDKKTESHDSSVSEEKSTNTESQDSNTNDNTNANDNTNTNSDTSTFTTEYAVASSDDLKIQEIKSSLENNMFTKLTNFFSA